MQAWVERELVVQFQNPEELHDLLMQVSNLK